VRKRGQRRGLDTPLVHALNDEDSPLGPATVSEAKVALPVHVLGVLANALNLPPEEYGRKVKTQRNRRGLIQVVEHVV